MDGEHAFSAALVLVMVNIAFPYNSRDASSMDAALSVLHGMAEKGNDFIRARHSMLVKMKSSNTSQAPPPTELTQIRNDLPMFQEMPFEFDLDDDPNIWEAVFDNIGVDMDADWIENALRREPAAAPR